jgi:hypothetical protein
MAHRYPSEVLTKDEADRARELVLAVGKAKAARMLLLDIRTLALAIAMLPVSRLTAETVRARLPAAA